MLSGKEFLKYAREAIAEHPEIFSALEEYDRTRRLPKLKYKTRVNFTIDQNLFNEFRRYCDQKDIKMSTQIEKLIIELLREK
jgi:hypothetical protein